SLIDEPPEVKLKDLPPHLEYTFLEGDDKLPVIIAKDLSVEEKTTLITVLKSHNTIVFSMLSVGRASSKVVLALTSFFLFCMSSIVTAVVLPFFLAAPSLAEAATSLGAS
nr:reverse transcriptase domain-containing protein [Tanacetum cinerariifolium]